LVGAEALTCELLIHVGGINPDLLGLQAGRCL